MPGRAPVNESSLTGSRRLSVCRSASGGRGGGQNAGQEASGASRFSGSGHGVFLRLDQGTLGHGGKSSPLSAGQRPWSAHVVITFSLSILAVDSRPPRWRLRIVKRPMVLPRTLVRRTNFCVDQTQPSLGS